MSIAAARRSRKRRGRYACEPGRPRRDLWLSQEHAVFVDDVLIPIRCLINGDSIRVVAREAITYYHVELTHHDVLLAEGLPVESYLDVGDRVNFANRSGVTRLFPDFWTRRVDPVMAWEAASYAPLILHGPRLE